MATIYEQLEAIKATKRPPKVPPIGQWGRTPKERGRRQGHVWSSPLSATGQFFIFANPNKPSQGPIKDFYITDGETIIAQGYRVRSDALKGLRLHLKEAMHQMLNVPSGQRVNPLTRSETAVVRNLERDQRNSARTEWDYAQELEKSGQPVRAMMVAGEAKARDAAAHSYGHVADEFGAGRPRVMVAPRQVNPLTQRESAEILQTADTNRSEAHRRHAAGNAAGGHHAMGFSDGQRSVVTQYGPADAGARHVERKLKRQRNPRPKLAPGELSAAQRAMLKRLAKGSISKKEKLALPDRSVLGALERKGLISSLKTMWKIKAKGRKKLGEKAPKASVRVGKHARPPRKKRQVRKSRTTPKGGYRRPTRKNPKTEICRHTLALEKGSKKKLTVCYPKVCFSSLKKAVLDIQRELRAQFGQLRKAPIITRAEWKFADRAKTKGRWHFTGKKRKAA